MPSLKEEADKLLGWLPEYKAMNDAYNEMNEKNLVKGDNYYHRLGMCRAAQLKNGLWASDKIAAGLGYLKEIDDARKKIDLESPVTNPNGFLSETLPSIYTTYLDSKKDLENNADGRRLGLQNPNIDCRILLKDFDYRSNQWKK